ncbi:ATP-binding protein [Sandaracinus amylolyticus]|uniref:ATP-binding protein n=1 Tax=Sandaracinus amylolyticus TaxID=927083 RepID=UPI001F2BA795|nr:ATP-binding protein [Sandaracinus amylolyticus]UJR82284.1 Hypothetical protein I5071_43490 [Sandaracinus amylolyticus]
MGETDREALILNVNDNLAARYMVTRMLRGAGYRVAEAATGQRAIELARGLPQPDVIVLDVKLPDTDGFEVCRQLKSCSETASIKVLHTSAAFVTPDKKVLGLEVGADGYLTQPFEPQELIATVRSLLRLRSAELELRARAERLIEADRRKDEFLAMLGHELRNPLAAISSALPLLAMQPARDPLEERARAVIDRQTKQLARLVGDLLEVARVTRGAIELRRERLDLRAWIATLAASMSDTLPNASTRRVELSLGEDPVYVEGDAARIEQIFTNLLDNAIRHTRVGGRIEIALRTLTDVEAHPRGVAELVLRDDGDGIAPEVLPKLFATFYQAAPGIARSAGGLGLGLSLVKRLIELHGGSVAARSDGLGRGSEFAVRFPLARAEGASEGSSGERSAGGVVLLSTDERTGETLRDLIGLWGHAATFVRDVPAAIDAIALAGADLVLIDVAGMTGVREVVRRLRAATSAAPSGEARIAAIADHSARRRVEDAGFDVMLDTPVDASSLREVLDTTLRARGQRRSA